MPRLIWVFAGRTVTLLVLSCCSSNEPENDKINKITCVHSEDSDQPRHPSSLISRRCPPEKNIGHFATHWEHSKELIRLGGCPNWSESSLGAQVILLVLSCSGSNDTEHQDSHLVAQANKWAAARQKQQNDLCAQRRCRSAWASTQSNQSLCCLQKALGP